MDVSRLSTGEKIAGAAAIALLIVMFISWFSLDIQGAADLSTDDAEAAQEDLAGAVDPDDDSVGINAWQAFGFIDIILLLAVIAGVGLAAMKLASTSVNLPVAVSAVTAGLGILATLLVIYRIIDTPYGFDRGIGVFLGLIAVAGVAYGGWMAMQEEGTSFQDQADRLQDRGNNPPPPQAGGPAA
ncbi:MAG TPA: hypothetical protein VD766_13105 [Solirubrobacterales bacterium]|nr:hypothetical protein [Solirubrobacterales bacterium]